MTVSHNYKYAVVVLFFLTAVCSAKVDCRKYKFDVVEKDLNILAGDEVVSKIKLPREGEVKNFSLDSVKKTRLGFQIKTDWGGSLYHYEVQFDFRCRANSFYLYRVKHVSLITTNPDSGPFWDKTKTKIRKPNLPIEKFVMRDYL
ncbi:MAG TPA: hypothetical protein VJT69_14970 [Pyrinomonadaceae bacterium]|nr:hypothetical protein [Pyrinomonadaceae bacterium]